MDLNQIKFAYKHKLYCHQGNKPVDLNSEYFWLYRDINCFLTIKKRSDKSLEDCDSVMDFYLEKQFISEGECTEWLHRKLYPNLSAWNDIHIDTDFTQDHRISSEVINEYYELQKEETIWHCFKDKNNNINSGYKLKE